MSNEEKFNGINFNENPYEEEARKRWGDQPVDEAKEKLARMAKDEQKDLSKRWHIIFEKLAHLRDFPPESEEAQIVIKEWYGLLNRNFGKYSPTAFSSLGKLYVNDERFTKNIDKYGEGLAKFMSKAMDIFTVVYVS